MTHQDLTGGILLKNVSNPSEIACSHVGVNDQVVYDSYIIYTVYKI